jgi:hypothetical protein
MQSFEDQHAFKGTSADDEAVGAGSVNVLVAGEAKFVELVVPDETELDSFRVPGRLVEAGSTSGCAAICNLETSDSVLDRMPIRPSLPKVFVTVATS